MNSADWQPTAAQAALAARAGMLTAVRRFFSERDVLEVETPVLSRSAATDPNLASVPALLRGSSPMYLQTSPEFAMKRLLAAGSGDIFQVCKVFRDGERGRQHNPEFTMLEWYRLGFSMSDLMRELADLLRVLLGRSRCAFSNTVFASYRDLCLAHTGLDPLEAPAAELAVMLSQRGVPLPDEALDRDQLLDLTMSAIVMPALPANELTFIFDYPASQASLALLNADGRTARRFEAALGGMELCNGFEELLDPVQQRERFERENLRRHALGLTPMPVDERLLAALVADLPACSGVALGLDRVLMLSLGASHIDQVIAFPVERA